MGRLNVSPYLLDTNILIAAIKGHGPVRKKLERVDAATILIAHRSG